MARQVALHHRTHYRYGRAVALGPHVIQLRPTPHCRTPILSYELRASPADHILNWQFDARGNHIARVLFPGKVDELISTVDLVAELTPINPFDFVLEPGYESFPFVYSPDLVHDLEPYLAADPAGPRMRAFVEGVGGQMQSTVDFLVGLNQRVYQTVNYTTRPEHGVQSSESTLEQRSGSCRDSAWLLVEVCRQLGLAARFVSGYLIQLAEENGEESARPSLDKVDLHAWAEVFLPGGGWIGMDSTSGLLTAEGHIPLACAPTPAQTAPISGTVELAGADFSFAMNVRRVNEPPSLATPYREDQWVEVRELAHSVDRDLLAQDVRLTTGGEPTFVGIDEPESLQWNFAALGPLKRTRGLELIWTLLARTAPGGLLHLGQGKWYPGEELPRWAFQCIARVDGVPVWENPALFAVEGRQYGFDDAAALQFTQALTRRLQVSADNILAAYEPTYGNLTEEADGPAEPAGYILPLRRRQPGGRLSWSSQLWFPRPERLFLSQGDSPIGFRIPVETMPWVAPDTLVHEFDSEDGLSGEASTGRVKLPPHPARRPDLFETEPQPDPLPPVLEHAEGAALMIRPSLCIEIRQGRLHVFLPFVPVLADFLDLLAAIEDTSGHLEMPVWIEGYTPPSDPRLRSFGLTPDPGVLEVNLPPAHNWDELEDFNRVLAEEAQRHRLIAGKFAYDGSHQATGGGSHITIGGPTLLESPVLRRPDLLRSMISFWQNHPSLSFLFAGMYVGPTSQHPRVDEARTDALYELEVSFSQLPEHDCQPYILDGLFRNILVDVSGNTHRAEFCIDKLYPPEGLGLRLGLLELRAFEMAPHPRMGLMQMLLVRTLVCLFWRRQFTGDLLRWGPALHDRFMLPYFVERDFAEVLEHLRGAGYVFGPGFRWVGLSVNRCGSFVQIEQMYSYGVSPLRVLSLRAKL